MLRKYRSELTLLLIVSILSFILAEVFLRKVMHLQPGYHTYSKWFTQVDTPKFRHGFMADSLGIFKIDSDARPYFKYRLTHNGKTPFNIDEAAMEIYGMETQFWSLDTQKTVLGDLLRSLKTKEDKDDVDSAILDYTTYPINEDGFKSIAFKSYRSQKKKILLIGDSFTWGHNAVPIGNCFADYLLSKDFIVYNTGISGSDPAQYLAVAKHYIPMLKPDYVFVNFFMGNDVFYFERIPKPFMPIFYSSDAGNLLSCPAGIYLNSLQSAYEYGLRKLTIPKTDWFSTLLTKTSVGGAVWIILSKLGYYSVPHPCDATINAQEAKVHEEKLVSDRQIAAIDSIASANGSDFFLLAIPDLQKGKLIWPDAVPHLFEKMNYYRPPVTEADYVEANGHYSNEGQLKHGRFIEQLIRENESKK